MASNIVQSKLNRTEEEQDREEDEALSLCDLPISLEDQPRNQEHSRPEEAAQEEFNFRSWGSLLSKETQMCAADEVFFKGQILPLRVSFSSEAGLLATGVQQHYGKQFVRSESFDFPSNCSSRSSSLRSQNSSSSTSSTTTTTTTPTPTPGTKPRIRNQFHTHPSPKPQLRLSVPTQSSLGNQGRKSTSGWGIFRLGVVPAPEIGLQDLKVRNRNCVVNSNSNSVKNVKTSNRNRGNNHHVFKHLVGKGGGGLLSGCNCSFDTVHSNNMVMIKGGAKSMNTTDSTTHAAKEKVVDFKKQKQGKKVTSHRRTFEWLKDLHASHPDEEALLLNPS